MSKRGLAGLVEAARERAAGQAVSRWYRQALGYPQELAQEVQMRVDDLLADLCRPCAAGLFRVVRPELTHPVILFRDDWAQDTAGFDSCPLWHAFRDAIDLADRIDSFLAVMSFHGPSPPLARDCADDLALLPVLADCCEDHGRHQSAQEARHLHWLVRMTGLV